MKTFLLALALFTGGLLKSGLAAPPHPPPAPPRAIAMQHSSFSRPHFPRPTFPHPNHNWNHTYWRVHRYGYWNHRRGYWTIRHGQHIFIDRD